jgi:hypothetical protein
VEVADNCLRPNLGLSQPFNELFWLSLRFQFFLSPGDTLSSWGNILLKTMGTTMIKVWIYFKLFLKTRPTSGTKKLLLKKYN